MSLRIGPYRFQPRLLTSLVALAMFTLLVGLGNWQLGRAGEKEDLLATRADAARAGVLAISGGALDGASSLVNRRARAEGTYDRTRQYLLDNQVHRGVAGYHVLTPLRPAAGGPLVIVNRGWVPVGESRAVLPPLPASQGPLVVDGSLASPPATGILLGDAGYAAGSWPRVVQTVDLERMSVELGAPVQPLLLRLAPEAGSGFVRRWRPVSGIAPERHLGYAVQWYSLAAALLVIYVVVNTRRVERS